MPKMVDKKAFPEGIHKGNWKVEEGFGSVNIQRKQLSIPTGEAENKQHVRNHEYFHIRFTPKDLGHFRSDKDELAIKAFEDCRVNILGKNAGVDASKSLTFNEVEKLKENLEGNRFLKICSVISALTYDVYEQLYNTLLEPIDKKIVDQLLDKIKANVNSYDEIKKLAQELVDMLFPPKVEEPKKKLEEIVKSVKEQSKSEEEEREFEETLKAEGEKFPEVDWNKVRSGKMAIKEHALTVRNVWHTKRRADTGLILKRPERTYTDGLCFEEKRKAPFRGTILIDCSGSMKLVVQKLVDIVKEGCGCLVAGYSGKDRTYGELHVLSDKGHMIQKIPTFYSGNTIDLPAVIWLAKKSGTKIWVSDGDVSDQAECFKVVEKHKIINVETVDETIELLKKLKMQRK